MGTNIRIRCDLPPGSIRFPSARAQFARVVVTTYTSSLPPFVFAVALTIFVNRDYDSPDDFIDVLSGRCCRSRCYRCYALISRRRRNDKYNRMEKGERGEREKRERERELI